MASQRTTRVLSFSLAIGTVIACVLVAETALRIIGRPTPAVSGWRFSGRASEANQLGFRGQPIRYGSDDFAVVMLQSALRHPLKSAAISRDLRVSQYSFSQ